MSENRRKRYRTERTDNFNVTGQQWADDVRESYYRGANDTEVRLQSEFEANLARARADAYTSCFTAGVLVLLGLIGIVAVLCVKW